MSDDLKGMLCPKCKTQVTREEPNPGDELEQVWYCPKCDDWYYTIGENDSVVPDAPDVRVNSVQQNRIVNALFILAAGAIVLAVGWIVLGVVIGELPADENIELWNNLQTGSWLILLIAIPASVFAGIYAYKKCPMPRSSVCR
jgi:hypothetical protein